MIERGDRKVTLTFKRHELLTDIRQYAYVEADIMPDEKEHAKHQTFDIGEDGNIERVTRIMSLAHSECVEALYPYTKHEAVDGAVLNDTLISDPMYVIEINVPATFSCTTAQLLEKYIHEYIICRVLWDWFSITKPEAAKNWKEKAEEAMDGLKTAKSIRMKKVRLGKSPF